MTREGEGRVRGQAGRSVWGRAEGLRAGRAHRGQSAVVAARVSAWPQARGDLEAVPPVSVAFPLITRKDRQYTTTTRPSSFITRTHQTFVLASRSGWGPELCSGRW